jgi:hypothetical protein
MDERVDKLLVMLRERDETSWVADQIIQSFGQGISMNVKEASLDLQFSALEPVGLSTREKQKREKYETTRPYSDEEKMELLREAIKTLFVELPAIQVAGMSGLQELGSKATVIEFVPPDEPERGRFEYSRSLDDIRAEQAALRISFSKFEEELRS